MDEEKEICEICGKAEFAHAVLWKPKGSHNINYASPHVLVCHACYEKDRLNVGILLGLKVSLKKQKDLESFARSRMHNDECFLDGELK